VRIIGRTYEIAVVPSDHDILNNDDGANLLGRVDHNKQRIAISDEQCLEAMQDTLMHEIVHAVESCMNITVSETAVTRFATGLLAVLRENPKVVEYLLRR
jgi:hypothetical protein